jgi:predicted naringenin-chalcone synthase
VKRTIGLSEEQCVHTRRVLSSFGNISSATPIFVLDEIIRSGLREGDWCVMVAFGAGFSAHALLLRKR